MLLFRYYFHSCAPATSNSHAALVGEGILHIHMVRNVIEEFLPVKKFCLQQFGNVQGSELEKIRMVLCAGSFCSYEMRSAKELPRWLAVWLSEQKIAKSSFVDFLKI